MNHYLALAVAALIVGAIACFAVAKMTKYDEDFHDPFTWRDAIIVYLFCIIPCALMEFFAWVAQYLTNY